jgi:hypothetical protein
MDDNQPEIIAVVLDPVFSSKLESVAAMHNVWITPSSENKSAAERFWHEHGSCHSKSLTVWRTPRSGSTQEEWESILDDLELHHSTAWGGTGILGIRVYGADVSRHAESAFAAFGYNVAESLDGGFRAKRTSAT